MPLPPQYAKWLYVPAVMALLAIPPLPYGYYAALRPIMWMSAGIVAWSLYQQKKQMRGLIWLFLGLSLIYNPVTPIHLNRWFWFPINLLSAGIFYWITYDNLSRAR